MCHADTTCAAGRPWINTFYILFGPVFNMFAPIIPPVPSFSPTPKNSRVRVQAKVVESRIYCNQFVAINAEWRIYCTCWVEWRIYCIRIAHLSHLLQSLHDTTVMFLNFMQ